MTDVALFMSALRAAVPADPDPGLEADLVPRLAAAARASTIEAETRVMRRRDREAIGTASRRRSRLASVAGVAAAIALIPLVLAGLAVAGVTVPSPARSAFDAVGITLPNQPSEDSAVGGSETNSPPAAKGSAGAARSLKSTPQNKGQSTTAHRQALLQRAEAEGNAIGHTRGKAIGLKELIPPGLSGDTGPPPHSNAGGSPNSQANSDAHPPHPTHPPRPTPVPRGNTTGQATTTQDQAIVGQ